MRVFEEQEMTANTIANTVLLSAGLGDDSTHHIIPVDISSLYIAALKDNTTSTAADPLSLSWTLSSERR